MNAQQKHAWYNLGVCGATLAGYLILLPFVGPTAALGAGGLLGFWGLGVVFYRKRSGEVVLDERDQEIQRVSLAIAYVVFWLCFVGGCMIPWWVVYSSGQELISVHALPLLVCGGMIVITLTQSVATLVQYRGGYHAEE